MKFLSFVFVFMIVCVSSVFANSYKPLLKAMYFVESTNGIKVINKKEPDAIGPYQIRTNYWKDAIEHRPEIGGKHSDCKDKVYSEKIILSYFDRYAKNCMNFEHLARLHNGGPSYMKREQARKNTLKYWKKIKIHLDNQ